VTDLQAQASIGSRLRADADLAFEFDEQYRARLCHLVEREMDRRFRPKEDPEDVVQSAFRTFFRRNAQGEFHIDSSVDLWRLLETITRRKILKHVEKLGAGKRSPKREEYAEGDDLQGSAPTPEEAAIAADLMEKSLAGLDESYVQVLHLRLQNCTEEEIAARLGCTRGHVRTRLQHIRQRLQKLSDDEEKPADLCAVLQYCLMSPASEYLTGLGQSADVAADPPPRRDPMDMTLGELFQRTDPPLGLLGAVMRRARRLMSPEASDSMLVARVSPPIEVHQILYFASIAAALVRHGERISKSSPDELRAAWKRLAAGPFADARLQRLFALAGELPNPGPSARLS
jgi:RNA polymerase sigma-70 factor (ECF subfamily)